MNKNPRLIARLILTAAIIVLNLNAVVITSAKTVENTNADAPITGIPLSRSSAPALSTEEGGPLSIQSTDHGVVLELTAPVHSIETHEIDGLVCQTFKLDGFYDSSQPGWPRLPYKGALIELPDAADPMLTILDEEFIVLDGAYDICPAAKPVVEISASGDIDYSGEEAVRDPEAYGLNSFSPDVSVELGDPTFIRSERVLEVQFHSFQYNPTSKQVRIATRIRVEVNFDQNSDENNGEYLTTESSLIDKALGNNLTGVQSSASAEISMPAVSINSMTSTESTQTMKLWVEKKGMYAVTYESLVAAGASFSGADPNTFRVTNKGQEVSIDVTGTADSTFDPGDQVLFYGEPVNTRYTAGNVYWLSWGQASGIRMTTLGMPKKAGKSSQRFLTTTRLEENKSYQSATYDSRGDHWFWDFVSATSAPANWNYVFKANFTDLSASSNAVLRGSFKSQYGTPQHHTKIYINGHFIGEGFYNTGTQFDFSFPFPNNYLLQGDNTLRIEIPLDSGITRDSIYLNWFELDYWRTYTAEGDQLAFQGEASGTFDYLVNGFTSNQINLFDITNPAAPLRMTDYSIEGSEGSYSLNFTATTDSQHKYLAIASAQLLTPIKIKQDSPSNLKSTSRQADYLLITHANFLTEMAQLAQYREQQGLSVALIDVEDIYDEFNFGIMDPAAIKDFLSYAYASWQKPAPQYVLLAGDGHFDPRNYKGTNEPIFIPAYLLPVDSYLSETASDNRYVTISGGDNFPDMMIGRLPIKTSAEAQKYISKLITYEQHPYTVEWNDDVLFVADNPDSGGSFIAYSEDLANYYLPTGYSARKVYLGSTHPTATTARSAILENINQGNLIVNYIGHGYQTSWAAENLLSNASIPSMTNTGKPALFNMMSCLTGYFHTPSTQTSDQSSLAEILTKADQTGAVVSWASSGLGLAAGQALLNEGLFQAMFYAGKYRIGEAVLQAKLYLVSNSQSNRDLIDLFTLFGDPATKMNVRPSDLTVQLSVSPKGGVQSGMPITYTLTYRNVGLAEASQVRINHPLPEELSDPVVHFSDPNGYMIEDSRLSWGLSSLLPGETGTIQVTGIVATHDPEILISQANILSPIFDADESNNYSDPVAIQVNLPTAVTLADSGVVNEGSHVLIHWQTSLELDLLGFNLWRSTEPEGEQTLIGMVPSQVAGSTEGSQYNFIDTGVTPGQTYYYELESLETGSSERFFIGQIEFGQNFYFPIIWN